jgi:hypothetical protein
MHAGSDAATAGYRDVTCSFCGRHNREVHMVGGRDGLTICAVCVARCAEILDSDTGVAGPHGGWSSRWPAKQVATAPNSAPADAESDEA